MHRGGEWVLQRRWGESMNFQLLCCYHPRDYHYSFGSCDINCAGGSHLLCNCWSHSDGAVRFRYLYGEVRILRV